jgi:transposase
MSDDRPSVSKLAGQLGYLFEDEPAQRAAPVEALAARLNQEDRLARAIARYPLETDAQIQAHLSEFEDRIPLVDVEAARARALGEGDS